MFRWIAATAAVAVCFLAAAVLIRALISPRSIPGPRANRAPAAQNRGNPSCAGAQCGSAEGVTLSLKSVQRNWLPEGSGGPTPAPGTYFLRLVVSFRVTVSSKWVDAGTIGIQ